jgi:magnesium-transporting ATPase (P-type)
VLADKLGEKYDKVRKEIKPVRIFPFSSKKKSMTTIIKNSDGGYRSYTKGASGNLSLISNEMLTID